MKKAGTVIAQILHDLSRIIQPGITTQELDDFIEQSILKNAMIPAFKGYNGYPAVTPVTMLLIKDL
jgi:methionyl aminopeptidase